MATLKDLERTLKNVGKQVKFAQATALSAVAKEISKAEKEHIEKTFDNATPFTLKSVKYRGARRDNLQAKVFIMPIAASYLEPFQYGGVHKLSGKTLLNPKEIRLNKYGNLPRTRTKTLLAREDVFTGEINGVRGIWQRKKRRKTAKRRRRSTAVKKRSELKLLIRFGDAIQVRQRLDFFGVAEETFNRAMPTAIQDGIQHAFETAKR